jgi:hypothetical protein
MERGVLVERPISPQLIVVGSILRQNSTQLRFCVYRKSDSAILVMKTAEDRSRCDDAEALDRAMVAEARTAFADHSPREDELNGARRRPTAGTDAAYLRCRI